MTLQFLSTHTVMTDIERFASSIQTGYNISSCVTYQQEEGNVIWLGYKLVKEGKEIIIKMPYARNERGELAIREKAWTVVVDSNEVGKDLASLGHVFDLLDIQKV